MPRSSPGSSKGWTRLARFLFGDGPLSVFRRASALAILLAALTASLFAPAGARPQAQISTDEQLNLIQERVSRLRGLESRGPIDRSFMNREELRTYYRETFFEENPIEEIETTQYLLELLGYIEPGVDIVQLMLDVLGEEVLGFYNRETKMVHVISERSQLTPTDVITLAHEVTHALQDQHYDLKAGFEARKGDNDRQLAYQALVEGDATLLQSLYALRYLSEAEMAAERQDSGGSRVLESAPLVVQRELLFPYEQGVNLLLGHFLEGSWPAVDAVWRDPPESTEQILHPEKYRAREGPVPVEMPDLATYLGSDWRLLEENNLGELDWQILIEQYVDPPTARRAAAGWGGDRFHLLRRDADGALVLGSRNVWDTEADAVEFFEAYQELAAGRHGAALETLDPAEVLRDGDPTPAAAWGARGGGSYHVVVRDDGVVNLVVSTDLIALAAVNALRFPQRHVARAGTVSEGSLP